MDTSKSVYKMTCCTSSLYYFEWEGRKELEDVKSTLTPELPCVRTSLCMFDFESCKRGYWFNSNLFCFEESSAQNACFSMCSTPPPKQGIIKLNPVLALEQGCLNTGLPQSASRPLGVAA